MATGRLSWFRNGGPQCRVPDETTPNQAPLFHSSLPLPLSCSWMEKRIGGRKAEDCELRYEQVTGNINEIKKQTATAAVLIKKESTRETQAIHMQMVMVETEPSVTTLPPAWERPLPPAPTRQSEVV